jgi:hypothetical protein
MPRRGFSVTSTSEARLFQAGNLMATMPESHHDEDDPLESSELARRLRRMQWPPAPADVKERVFRRIVDNASTDDASDSDSPAPPRD